MPSTVREARIAALEAELSALRGDRPAVHYDHNEPLEDPYAHTGVDPVGRMENGPGVIPAQSGADDIPGSPGGRVRPPGEPGVEDHQLPTVTR